MFLLLLVFLIVPISGHSMCAREIFDESSLADDYTLDAMMSAVRDDGDEESFTAVRAAMRSFVRKMLQIHIGIFPDEHPDLEQDIFLELWKTRSGFTGNVRGRVAAIAKNTALDRLNFWRAQCRRYNRTVSIDRTSEDGNRIDLRNHFMTEKSPDEAMVERDLRAALAARIDAIPGAGTNLFIGTARTFLIGGRSVVEIELATGVSNYVASYRVKKGLRLMREAGVFENLGLAFDEMLPAVQVKDEASAIPEKEVHEFHPSPDYSLHRDIVLKTLRDWRSSSFFEWNLVRFVLLGINLNSASFKLAVSPVQAAKIFSRFEEIFLRNLKRAGLSVSGDFGFLGFLKDVLISERALDSAHVRFSGQWVVDHWLATGKFKTLKLAWEALGREVAKLPDDLRVHAEPVLKAGPAAPPPERSDLIERIERTLERGLKS